MAIHVEIKRGHNENTTSTIRKFTRRVQSTGILPRARSLRFWSRSTSKATARKQALRRLERQEKYEHLLKMGKISETTTRGKGKGGRR